MYETLSERFVKNFNALEDSQVSASDYMAWQRWLYCKKLREAGADVPEIDEKNFEYIPGASEGERYLDIFETLPDTLQVDVLNYIDWLKMAEEAEDEQDIAYCKEHYDDDGVIDIRELWQNIL